MRSTQVWIIIASFTVATALAATASAESVEVQLHEARQLYVDEAYEQAIDALKAILEDHPDLAEAHLFHGHAAYALEQHDEARRAYARAIEAGRLDAAMLARLAQLEQRDERRASALAALRLLILVAPQDHHLHLALAEAAAAAGLDAEAEQLYRQIIDARPAQATNHLRLANLHLTRDRWREAIQPMTLAYLLGDPDATQARTLGDLHTRAEQPDAAAAWYERARDAGLDDAALHLRLAQAHLALDNRDAARDAAERAAEDEGPDAGRALVLLGQLAREAGELDQAVAYWTQAASRELAPMQVHVYLATHAYEAERFDTAIEHLAAARAAGDREAATLRLLVLSHLHEGQPSHARAVLLEHIEQHGLDRTAAELVGRVAHGSD